MEDNEGPYISYENAPSYWKLKDGTSPPKKKYFEEPVYNKDTRTFTGNITWGENTFGDAFKWKYKMIFASEFLTITGGQVDTLNENESVTKSDYFGPGHALRYKIY